MLLAEALLKKFFTHFQSVPTMLLVWGSEISDSCLVIKKRKKIFTISASFIFLVGYLQVAWNNISFDQNYDS